jgi:hypothetical protein
MTDFFCSGNRDGESRLTHPMLSLKTHSLYITFDPWLFYNIESETPTI